MHVVCKLISRLLLCVVKSIQPNERLVALHHRKWWAIGDADRQTGLRIAKTTKINLRRFIYAQVCWHRTCHTILLVYIALWKYTQCRLLLSGFTNRDLLSRGNVFDLRYLCYFCISYDYTTRRCTAAARYVLLSHVSVTCTSVVRTCTSQVRKLIG